MKGFAVVVEALHMVNDLLRVYHWALQFVLSVALSGLFSVCTSRFNSRPVAEGFDLTIDHKL